MIIGLHDSDKTNFPNLALMKISAAFKAKGNEVEWWNPLRQYDVVYSSKVFTFTPEEIMLPDNTVRGGTGYGMLNELDESTDSAFPDYSIYPQMDGAIGFLTRGCINNCPWCIVPRKEGGIKPYRTWREVKRKDSDKLIFMDNNVLAIDFGVEQMASMIGEKVKIDFNQGLDARLITPEVAEIISKLKWIRQIRMSCDTEWMLDTVLAKVDLLKKYGVKPWKIFVYLLVQDVPSAERRAYALREAGVDVFAQPYRDFENLVEPTQEMRDFARFVNRKEIFKSISTFADYKRHKPKADIEGQVKMIL